MVSFEELWPRRKFVTAPHVKEIPTKNAKYGARFCIEVESNPSDEKKGHYEADYEDSWCHCERSINLVKMHITAFVCIKLCGKHFSEESALHDAREIEDFYAAAELQNSHSLAFHISIICTVTTIS